jgi:hypothetical protein
MILANIEAPERIARRAELYLVKHGVKILRSYTPEPWGEQTQQIGYVCQIPYDFNAVAYCEQFHQDCIAIAHDKHGAGELIPAQADITFNSEFFKYE